MQTRSRVRVFAPASASNLGPGFDILGLALSAPGDFVEAEVADRPGVELAGVTGDGGLLSRDPAVNVAGIAASALLSRLRAEGLGAPGVRLWLEKRMPMASGLGSSAASSVAGAMAVNELFGRPLPRRELLAAALEGERAASGAGHADNAAPSLLGGIVLIRSYDPLDLVELPVPPALWITVVHPHAAVRTEEARALVMSRGFRLADCVANLGNAAAMVAALYRNDLELLGRSIEDRLVEPVRAALIPAHAEVKRAALGAGALGCSISGSGPSIFAMTADELTASGVAMAMTAAFREAAGLASDAYVGLVNTSGATVREDAAG